MYCVALHDASGNSPYSLLNRIKMQKYKNPMQKDLFYFYHIRGYGEINFKGFAFIFVRRCTVRAYRIPFKNITLKC